MRISGDTPVPGAPSDPTSTCSPAAGPAGARNYEFTPSMAVDPGDPKHLVAAWGQDLNDAIAFGVSRDGGTTWQHVVPPGFLACGSGPAGNPSAIDPHVSIGADGTVYAVAVLHDGANRASAIAFSSSRDGGATWRPTLAHLDEARPEYSIEWSAVAADPRRPGVAYAAWDRHTGVETPAGGDLTGGDQWVARTLDWGDTWTAVPLRATPGMVWSGAALAVLNDGTLVDAFTEYDAITPAPDSTVRVARLPFLSSTWNLSDQRVGAGSLLFSDIATDRSNDVYVAAFESGGLGATIAHSSDGGGSFVSHRVAEASSLYLLSLAVTTSGRLGVLYDEAIDGQYYGVHFTTSTDGGATFDDGRQVAGPFDPNALPRVGADNGGLGTYQSLVAVPGGGFAAAYTAIYPTADQAIYGPTDIMFQRL